MRILLILLIALEAHGAVVYPPGTTAIFQVSITNTKCLYVSPNGNDSTAVRGRRDFPWKKPEAAGSNLITGDVLFFEPGIFYASNYIMMPTNGAIIGSGQGVTVIYNYWTNQPSPNGIIPLFNFANNSTLAELTIVNGPRSVGATNIPTAYGEAWGLNGNLRGSCTNISGRNLTADGFTDIVGFNNPTAPCSGVFENITQDSFWDANVLSGQFAHQFTFINPHITIRDVSSFFNTGLSRAFHLLSSQQILKVYGGYVTNLSPVGRIVYANNGSPNAVDFYGTMFYNAASTWVHMDSFNDVDTINFHGMDFNPVKSDVTSNGGVETYGGLTVDSLNMRGILRGNGSGLTNLVVSITNNTVYASGTAYTLTTSSAALDFGTTDPNLTISTSGTYLIHANVGVKYSGATYVGAQTVTFKLRRTNNTAADLTSGSRAVELPVLTTFTGGDVMALPPVIYTATAGDVVTIFGILSATPSAGSVVADSAELVAIRLY